MLVPKNNKKPNEKQGGGRKRSASKVEDDNLVKRLKVGKSVERNERQTKMLDDLNLGMLRVFVIINSHVFS